MTLLDFVRQDIDNLKLVASTEGGEWHGACPACGGNDRFRVQPNRGPTGKFACRVCGIWGDGIDYLKKFKSLSFPEACKELNYDPPKNTITAISKRHIDDSWRYPKKRELILKGDFDENIELLKLPDKVKPSDTDHGDSFPPAENTIGRDRPIVNDFCVDTFEDCKIDYDSIPLTIVEKLSIDHEAQSAPAPSFPFLHKTTQKHLEALGCKNCTHLHGQACSYSGAPSLVGLFEKCPKTEK